jgi:chromosome segregation ATPase
MTGHVRPHGIDRRLSFVLAIALALLIGSIGVWGAGANADPGRARGTLDTTDAEIASTRTSLSSAEAALGTTKQAIASESRRLDAATAHIRDLNGQIERKGACIAAQSGSLTELRRILALQRRNFGRTTSTSTWAKAHAAGDRAIDLAITHLYRAYQSAAAGRPSTANSWISKSNAQVRISNGKVKAANAEIKRINAASDSINTARDAFVTRLDEAIATCGA